jgi:ferric-dicitrate binding protein FerR (iron transport regulator)
MTQDPSKQDCVGTLVRTAGPRAFPDAERFQRARARVGAEWREVLARERRARYQKLAAVFVITAIAATLGTVFWPKPAQPIATADRVVGDVLVRHAERGHVQAEPLKAEQALAAGTELDTGSSGRALLQWTGGAQLRVDRQSLLELRSESELRLTRGAVYIETNSSDERNGLRLAVTTPFGTARHIGTRFEVHVDEAAARVRVRDGAVSFSSDQQSPVTINAGQQLTIANGALTLQPGPGSADSAWEWLRNIAPHFAIEGRSAFDALEWLGHESGLRIDYADEQVRSQARAVTLRGTIEGLETRKALFAVLAGSGLDFEIRGDHIDIHESDEP